MQNLKIKLYQNTIIILLAGSLTGCTVGTLLVWGKGFSWTELGVETVFGRMTCVATVTGLCAIVYRLAGAINSFVHWSLHAVVATVSLSAITLYYVTRVGTDDPFLADGHLPIRGGPGLLVSFVFIGLYVALLVAAGAVAGTRGRISGTSIAATPSPHNRS